MAQDADLDQFLRDVRSAIDRFLAARTALRDDTQAGAREVDLRAHLLELVRPPYGPNRRAYLRAVAAHAPSARHQDVLQAVAAAEPDPKDVARAVGGTHSSVERCWRAHGLPGALYEGRSLPDQWIVYDDHRGVHVMD